MENTKVIVTFSNNEQLTLKWNDIIFPIKVVEHNGEKYTSKSNPLVLDENALHLHDGFIPDLTSTFSLNDYFTVNTDTSYETKIYKTSAIVSLEQYD